MRSKMTTRKNAAGDAGTDKTAASGDEGGAKEDEPVSQQEQASEKGETGDGAADGPENGSEESGGAKFFKLNGFSDEDPQS